MYTIKTYMMYFSSCLLGFGIIVIEVDVSEMLAEEKVKCRFYPG